MHFSTLMAASAMALACSTGLIQAAPVQARGGNGLYGITYTARNSDGSCQSADQVLEFVKDFKNNGIKNIRTYSQECDQLTKIADAIQSVDASMKMTAAVWLDGSSNDDDEIKSLISNLKANGNKNNIISSITVGNEVIFNGKMSSSTLVQKIKQVKDATSSFNIPIGTVDTPNTFPSEVISACDVIGVNIHPFFANIGVEQAGSNMVEQYNAFVKSKAHGKPTFIAETGWPSAGGSNGKAVPSAANVQSFVHQLISVSGIKYYYFEALDSNWKQGSGVETHFGLFGESGKSKVSIS